jgi:four helix bundle protein
MGSASEVEYHLLLAKDLGFLDRQDFMSLTESIQEIKRMLASLRRAAREQPRN